jgi:hypothetical protein
MPVALATAPIGIRAVFTSPAREGNLRVVIAFVLSLGDQLSTKYFVEFIFPQRIDKNNRYFVYCAILLIYYSYIYSKILQKYYLITQVGCLVFDLD